MYSFCRFALGLALLLPATHVVVAQSSSSSTTPAPQDQAQQPQATPQNQGEQSVQARIKARREQRRIQAIHDTYSHLYEAFIGGGYQRFRPGSDLQLVTMYSWDVAFTRYYSTKLGVTLDGRGYYGTAFTPFNKATNGAITRPAISQYGVLGGPTYRFVMHPKYSVAAHLLGGVAIGNFSGDTSGFSPQSLGLWADSTTYAVSAQVIGEYNVSPALSLRLGPEYYLTGFGSSTQNNYGFTYGFVYRFGKQ
jgi:hypothetical protein